MLKYLNGYDVQLKSKVQTLIDQKKLGEYLLSRYSDTHVYTTDKSLYIYVQELKNAHLRSSSP
ncbi:MAG: metal-dependent hydrolase, partial [Sulfurovum sp.]|nr:metal-dependent hydrolase [Sulfurovum sp.]